MWRCCPVYSCVTCSSMAWLVWWSAAKRGRHGLADLEVDGAVLDLDDYIGLELAVEGAEVVVAGAGAVGLEVVPVEVIVVDEAAIKHDAAMRLERAGHGVCRLRGSPVVLRRTGAAL